MHQKFVCLLFNQVMSPVALCEFLYFVHSCAITLLIQFSILYFISLIMQLFNSVEILCGQRGLIQTCVLSAGKHCRCSVSGVESGGRRSSRQWQAGSLFSLSFIQAFSLKTTL